MDHLSRKYREAILQWEYDGCKSDEKIAEEATERRHQETLKTIKESNPFDVGGIPGLIAIVIVLWGLKAMGAF